MGSKVLRCNLFMNRIPRSPSFLEFSEHLVQSLSSLIVFDEPFLFTFPTSMVCISYILDGAVLRIWWGLLSPLSN